MAELFGDRRPERITCRVDKNIAFIKALYMTPNLYQYWAWGLTLLIILFFIKPTRRFGGIGFCVGLGCMFLYFAMIGAMKDFAPKQYSQDELTPKSRKHTARPW